jgi:penicillin amidase
LGKRLPTTSGSINITGIEQPIEIGRDRFGVPHIRAAGDLDAWFGLGFCQGQDRAFQLETRLRLVRGTLSALVGADALALDRLSRRIDFAASGERTLQTLDSAHGDLFAAFASGIRSGMVDGGGARSHEFLLLRSKPTPFQATDSLGFLAVLAFSLASNWDTELARLRMLILDGPEAVSALHPPYPASQPAAQRPGEAAGRVVDALADDLAHARDLFIAGGGSNNWAISGDLTASGRPILANDPHLAPILPAHWYLAHLQTPDWSMVGGSIPGIPGFGFGHNGTAAWGVTAGLIDNTDLYVEDIGDDGRSVRRGSAFVPCTVRTERIEVKGGDPVDIEVLETDRGPVVGPAFDGPFGGLSMAATWFEAGNAGALLDMCRIGSFEAMRQAFRGWTSIPLNVAYADAATIGWHIIGSAPIRGVGGGTIPTKAADPATQWEGAVPYDDLPRVSNPDAGFVVTANNQPSTSGPYLGSDFLDGYRAARITEALLARSDWTVAATLQLQMDRLSIPWREMRDSVLEAAAPAGELGVVANMLREWDGVVATDSAAAAVFEVFTAEMAKAVARAKAPNSSRFALGAGFTPLVPFSSLLVRRVSHLVELLRERPDGWFDRGWDEAIRDALRAAQRILQEAVGGDSRKWGWGEIRQVTLVHPMGLRKPLDRVWNIGPLPHGGDANTVNPGPVDPLNPLGSPEFAIASGRMVLEVGAWDLARFCLPGGQSGNPFSPHYADQVELWLEGDAMVIPFSDPVVDRAIRSRLHLVPDQSNTAS